MPDQSLTNFNPLLNKVNLFVEFHIICNIPFCEEHIEIAG